MKIDYESGLGVYGTALNGERFIKNLETRKSAMDKVASSYPRCGVKNRFILIHLVCGLLEIKFTDKRTLAEVIQYSRTFESSNGSAGWALLLWQYGELPPDANSDLLNHVPLERPGVQVKSSPSSSFTFHVQWAPQEIEVLIDEVLEDGEVSFVLKLLVGESEKRFLWADWIDTAMGFFKGIE